MSADDEDTKRPVPDPQPAALPAAHPSVPPPHPHVTHHAHGSGSIASHALEAFHDPTGAAGRGGFTFGSQPFLGLSTATHTPHAADDHHKPSGR